MDIATRRAADDGAAAAAAIDVRSIRKTLGLSQTEFGARFGFPPATVRRWEQGRSRPDAPCRAYLIAIRAAPDVVAKAIAAARPELERA